ncbi:MAG: T9SS type A sorting domain-containing protein [Bacteroidales bacterium]
MAGDMTNWDFVSMLEDPAHNWSVTLNIPPGSYAWNAAGDDGSGSSFWVMPDSHLNVTVDQDGNTTGDNSYVYMVVGESAIDLSVVKVFPNPAGTHLFVEAETPIRQIRVMNTANQVVYSSSEAGSDVYELNVGQFAPGIYMVQVETVSGMALEKVQVGTP